jgi:hypothetical protein
MAGDFTMMMLLDIPQATIDHFRSELESNPSLEGTDFELK